MRQHFLSGQSPLRATGRAASGRCVPGFVVEILSRYEVLTHGSAYTVLRSMYSVKSVSIPLITILAFTLARLSIRTCYGHV